MKISLPSWLLKSPADSTVAELENQLENAHSAHDEAQAALKQAAEDFDNDPKLENAVIEAQDALRRTAAHVERAQRLLNAGKVKEAEHQRAEWEVEEAMLSERLRTRSLAARNRNEKVSDALMLVAQAQAERVAERKELESLVVELARVTCRLNGTDYAETHTALEQSLPGVWLGEPLEKFRQKLTGLVDGDVVQNVGLEILRKLNK